MEAAKVFEICDQDNRQKFWHYLEPGFGERQRCRVFRDM